MPEKELRRIAASILASSGLMALAVAGAGGWYFLFLPVVPMALIFVLLGLTYWFR